MKSFQSAALGLAALAVALPATAQVVRLECKTTRVSDNADLSFLITFNEDQQQVTSTLVETGFAKRYPNAIVTSDLVSFQSTALDGNLKFVTQIDRKSARFTRYQHANTPLGEQVMARMKQPDPYLFIEGSCKKSEPSTERAF